MKNKDKTKEELLEELAEIKLLEGALRDREKKLQSYNSTLLSLIDSTDDATLISDKNSGPVLWNQAYARTIKEALSIDMRKGLQPHKLLKDEKIIAWWDNLHKRVLSGESFRVEYSHDFNKGGIKHFEISYNPILVNGEITGFSEFTRDITERKKAEKELTIKNRAIESSLSAIGITDAEGKLLYVNDSLVRMWGYENKNEVLGKGLTDFWEGDRVCKTIKNTLEKGGDLGEDRGKRKDGSVFDVQFSSSLIKNKDGHPQYFFGSFLDISEQKNAEQELKNYHKELELRVQERTLDIEQINKKLVKQILDRKAAEEAVRESEMRFRIAATTVSDFLWEGDVRDNSLNWYGDIDRYLGYENGEFPRTISGHMESIHPDDREWFIKNVDKALKTGNDFRAEYRIRCKDGTYRYWDETGKAIAYEDGKAVEWIGCVTDITDRKNIENQIMTSENQFKKLSQEFNALLDAIPDNIVLLDSDLKILWTNRATARQFNKKSSRMKGQHCYDFYRNVSTPCENCPAIASFNSGREETARRTSASGEVWDIRTFPVKNDGGQVKNVIEVARDVSLTYELEKEASEYQAKLIHANKMTSLGTLVTGVAHEINNPNSFIMTNADLFSDIWKDAFKLLNKLDDGYKDSQIGGVSFSDLGNVAPKLLRGIYDGSGRIKNIIDNLRDFARSDGANLDEKVDVNKAVRSASNILDTHIKKNTDNYYLSCRDDIPFIKGNSQQIEQVVINLIMNSLQALTDSHVH